RSPAPKRRRARTWRRRRRAPARPVVRPGRRRPPRRARRRAWRAEARGRATSSRCLPGTRDDDRAVLGAEQALHGVPDLLGADGLDASEVPGQVTRIAEVVIEALQQARAAALAAAAVQQL